MQLSRHLIRITLIDRQLAGNLLVGQVESHKIQTQAPHFQRLMMSGKDRVSQIIKAFVTVVTLIALTGGFRIIKAAPDHTLRLTRGTLDTIGPLQIANGLITLHIIDEILDVDLHGWTPVRGSRHGVALVYTILKCHDPGIQKERLKKITTLDPTVSPSA
jgi:hypothetical protein